MPKIIKISHSWYGCECGCCGMLAEVYKNDKFIIRNHSIGYHETDLDELKKWAIWEFGLVGEELQSTISEFGDLICPDEEFYGN